MCDLTHQNRDTYVETVKSIVYDRLGRDDDQIKTIEEYGAKIKITFLAEVLIYLFLFEKPD